MTYSTGFVYVATGGKFVEEAVASVKSLKRVCNDVPTLLFTDNANIELGKKQFDEVRVVDSPNFNFIDKIKPLLDSPFEKSIFIDSDTFIIEDISGLFEILEQYDFFASFAPGRGDYTFASNLPTYFPEFNTGIIGFNNSSICRETLADWLSIYTEQLQSPILPPHDQPAFRKALYKSDAKIYCLPEEYNFRITNPNIVWANSTVKIIHGRHNDYPELERLLNGNKGQVRVFYHDARFLNSKGIRFFNAKQNGASLFSLSQLVFSLTERIKYKFIKNGLPEKRKGN